MRFPRISRLRWDKPPSEADTIETLEALLALSCPPATHRAGQRPPAGGAAAAPGGRAAAARAAARAGRLSRRYRTTSALRLPTSPKPPLTSPHDGIFPDRPDAFIARWRESDASERANAQSFLNDLIDLLGEPRPDNAACRAATATSTPSPSRAPEPPAASTSTSAATSSSKPSGRRRAADRPSSRSSPRRRAPAAAPARPAWDDAMVRARGQAEAYARALPDEYPPFLVTVAVGQVIELWADFSRTGKNYTHFPDARRFRIALDDLRDTPSATACAWSGPTLTRSTRPAPPPASPARSPAASPRSAARSRRRATPPKASPAS